MKIIYVAEDGTHFDNKADCAYYEQCKSLKGIYAYDDKRNRISLNSVDVYETEIIYVLADSYLALDAFNDWCHEKGIDAIPYEELDANYCDLFCWNVDDNSWHSWQKDCEELKEIGEYFNMTPVF